jgi:atypical dual specificity phosphatase
MSQWFNAYGFDEVHPHLIVGAVPLDANDVQVLADAHVDRVLNLVQSSEYPDGARLEVEIGWSAHAVEEVRVEVVDFGNLDPAALESAVSQVNCWLDDGHIVYLHCRAGWQRSATVAAGVIAIREKIDISEALSCLRVRKPSAHPLPHQAADLAAWYAQRPRG